MDDLHLITSIRNNYEEYADGTQRQNHAQKKVGYRNSK